MPVTSADAVRFCAQAALTRASYDIVGELRPVLDYERLARLASDCIVDYETLGRINASRGRTRVLKLIDKFLAHAIEAKTAETAARAAGSVRSTRARSPQAMRASDRHTFSNTHPSSPLPRTMHDTQYFDDSTRDVGFIDDDVGSLDNFPRIECATSPPHK